MLKALLNDDAYAKVTGIMEGDQYLYDKAGSTDLGNAQYNIAFFGNPSNTSAWAVQFGGHHVGINATFDNGATTYDTSQGKGIYFQISGPKAYIELSSQDNTAGAEIDGVSTSGWGHIHTIYRDPTNDYAGSATQQKASAPTMGGGEGPGGNGGTPPNGTPPNGGTPPQRQ